MSCIYLVLFTVDHSKCFYTTGFAFTHSHTHIHRVVAVITLQAPLAHREREPFMNTHALMAQHQEQFGVQCLAQGHEPNTLTE